MTSEWIVICQQVIGGQDTAFEISYNWDGERFPTRAKAKRHGFNIRGSDDFNLAEVEGDLLLGFFWMEDRQPDDELPEIAAQLSLGWQQA